MTPHQPKSGATPGPWTMDKSRMVLGPCFTGELKAICEKVRGGNPSEADANARLIAAAPDLLAALQAAKQFIENGVELGYIRLPSYKDDPALKTLPMIQAAIARATQA